MEPIPHLILDLLKKYISPEIRIDSSNSLGGGCINHAMRLNTSQGDFFIKWNNNCPVDLFIREAESLEELAKPETLLILPKVLVATELKDEEPAVIIMEFLRPARGGKKEIDEKLGNGLAHLHQYQSKEFGFYHDNYCGSTQQDNSWSSNWIEFFGEQRIRYLLKLIEKSRSISTNDQSIYDQLIEKLPALIGHDPRPSLNHGDLWSGNYMHTERGPALIDPASYYADREFDLSIMNMFGGFSSTFWSAYQESYPLPPEWKERNELYMIYHYLNHFYLFGGYYGHQALTIANKFI